MHFQNIIVKKSKHLPSFLTLVCNFLFSPPFASHQSLLPCVLCSFFFFFCGSLSVNKFPFVFYFLDLIFSVFLVSFLPVFITFLLLFRIYSKSYRFPLLLRPFPPPSSRNQKLKQRGGN